MGLRVGSGHQGQGEAAEIHGIVGVLDGGSFQQERLQTIHRPRNRAFRKDLDRRPEFPAVGRLGVGVKARPAPAAAIAAATTPTNPATAICIDWPFHLHAYP